MDIDLIAEACHEANRVLQRRSGEVVNFPWENTSESLRNSARSGVQAIVDNPDLTARESHEGWTAYKLAEGWVYGPVKDFAAKTHPDLVPYDELPLDQQVKDSLFGAIVRALAK